MYRDRNQGVSHVVMARDEVVFRASHNTQPSGETSADITSSTSCDLAPPDRLRLDMVTAINNVGLARIDEHSLVTFGAAGPISQNVMQAENYGWKQSPRLEWRIGIHHLALERIEARFYRNEGPSITLV